MERIHLDIVEAINKGEYAEAHRLIQSITDHGFRKLVAEYLRDYVGREKIVSYTGWYQEQRERELLKVRDSLKGKLIKEVLQDWDNETVHFLFEDGSKAEVYRGCITVFAT